MEWIARYWLETAFGAAVTVLGIGYRLLAKRLKDNRQEESAIKQGVQALLRDRIIQAHNHYQAKGACPIYAKENVEDLHRAYTGLGGNGTVTGLVETLMRLPTTNEGKEG